MSTSLPYIEPKAARVHVKGEWQFIPHIFWPQEYKAPNFEQWRTYGKESAARNIVALFLIEAGLDKDKVGEFLELSPARVSAINRAMQIRLFGKDYKLHKKIIEKQIQEYSNNQRSERMLEFYLEKRKNFSLYRMQAILAALSRMGRDTKDHQLFHHAMEHLAKNGISIELGAYDNAL